MLTASTWLLLSSNQLYNINIIIMEVVVPFSNLHDFLNEYWLLKACEYLKKWKQQGYVKANVHSSFRLNMKRERLKPFLINVNNRSDIGLELRCAAVETL